MLPTLLKSQCLLLVSSSQSVVYQRNGWSRPKAAVESINESHCNALMDCELGRDLLIEARGNPVSKSFAKQNYNQSQQAGSAGPYQQLADK